MHKTFLPLFMMILYVLTVVVGCSESQTDANAGPQLSLPPLPEPVTRTVSYAEDIVPLFEASCIDCHTTENPKGEFSVATYAEVMAGSKSGAVVLPGKSAESMLVELVHSQSMPKRKTENPPFTSEQIALLRGWIDQGAKE